MTALWPFVVLAAVLGLAVGSFLNVVIHRVPRQESVVSPPSHCPNCDTPIKGRHNVPVLSWLALGGKCASCRVPISARYPLVEAATGLLFAVIVLRFGLTAQVPAYLYFAAIAVSLAMIEFDIRRVPDSIVVPSFVVGLALLVPAAVVASDWYPVLRALGGAAVLGLLGLMLVLAFPAVGFGSAKLAGLLGLYLGWLSWTAVLVGVLATLLVAGVGEGVRLLADRPRRVPAGPCLIAGAVLTVVVAAPIV